MLGAWALAFGCAVGSDAFVMPWNDFLPKAGPLGTVLGVFIGGLVMAVVAWNFHYMINRWPGPGGAYAYASKAFGHDHGFLCGFLLGFAYLAIVWLDVTALVVVARYMLGDAFRFGSRYTIQERNIYLGDILLSVTGGDRLHVPDVHPRAYDRRRGSRPDRRRGRLGQFGERAGLPRV